MRRAGAKNARINVIYGKVKGEGYGKIDQEVNALRAAGIAPQITLMSTPGYMAGADSTLSAANNNPRQWQAFANEVARHFKGRVGRYSIGNEMNLPTFLAANNNGALAGGRAYRGTYRGGYAGVKAADPTAQVLMGELTANNDSRDFLRGLFGGKSLKTAGFAYHPYDKSISGAPAAGRNTWDIDNLPDLQATLARYKRQGKLQTAKGSAAPLYLTEMGYFRGGKLSDPERVARMARAYRLAQQAGARQFLSYQIAPTQRPMVQAPPAVNAEGGMVPGAVTQAPGWVWDTSLDPAALGAALRRPKVPVAPAVSAARVRVAKVRPMRKKR
jgi:hypothetical protein